MTPTRLLIGAAAAALLSTAAFAQSSMAPASAQPDQMGGSNAVNAAPTTAAPMAGAMPAPAAPSASSMGADASVTASSAVMPPAAGSFTVSTVTNGPVPDTAENRSKYGSPMSRAGKMTRASGN